MISVSLNGSAREIEQTQSLADLLTGWGYVCERVAVARNGDFVARADYGKTTLQPGDRIDVVAPVQGG